MKIVIASVMTCAALGAVAQESRPAAQPETPAVAQESLPTAASLFEKHIAAVGGLEALQAERNRMVRATYSIPARSAEGQMRVLRVAPDKFYMMLEIPGITTQETWCNANGAWTRESNTGARRLSGEALADLRLQAAFLGEAGYKDRYREITTIGKEKLDEAEMFVVLAVPHEAKPRKLYFDATTGLLAAIRNSGGSGPDSDPVTRFSDYKKFGAVQHPTRSVTRVGQVEIGIITITKVESNLAVMPNVEPPDEIKALK